MEDSRIFLSDITTDILDNYFPQIDTLSQLITPDPIRATRIIVNRIVRILDRFEKYCPLTAVSKVKVNGDGYYTFKNNYLDIVEGRESKENLELIPKTIARVGGNSFGTFTNLSSTANYWHYNAPTLKCYARGSTITVRAFYHYPIYVKYTKDGLLDQYSHIFGLDAKQKNMLYNIMELEFLKFIKGNAERVKLQIAVEFFNLDNDIQLLQQQVEEDEMACAAAALAWS